MRRSPFVLALLLVVAAALFRSAGPAAQNPSWTSIANMTTPRFHEAAATGPHGIYMIGGDATFDACALFCAPTDSVEYYDPAHDTWSRVAPMHMRRDWLLAATGLDGRVYAFGGYSPDCDCDTDTAEVYTPSTNSWRFIHPMPEPRVGAGATTGADGKIYILGGGPSVNDSSTTVFIYSPDTDSWTTGPPMLEALGNSTAATGSDGRLYAIGGAAQVFDPHTQTWTLLPTIPHPRGYLGAAGASDGKIYVVGGYFNGPTTEVDAYSPSTNSWSVGPSMNTPRSNPGVALGGDGNLYAAGGHIGGSAATDTAERLTLAASLAVPVDVRPDQCPNRLRLDSQEDLAVAIAGTTHLDPAQVNPASVRLNGVAPLRFHLEDVTVPYHPYLGKKRSSDCTLGHPDGIVDLKLKFSIPALAQALGGMSGVTVLHLKGSMRDGTPIVGEDVVVLSGLGTWSPTGSLHQARAAATATMLHNGTVLVAGGFSGGEWPGTPLATAEIYNASTGSWTATGSMHVPRARHSATLLPDGRVLVSGGDTTGSCCEQTMTAELYDPHTGTWTMTGSMHNGRSYAGAVLLKSGKVLTFGGMSPLVIATAELYDPASGLWTVTGSMQHRRYSDPPGLLAAVLPNGDVLTAGGAVCCYTALSTAELYSPGTGTWSSTHSLQTARQSFPTLVLPNGKVLAAGGATGTCCPFPKTASAELYDASSNTWAGTGPLGTARDGFAGTVLTDGKALVAGGSTTGLDCIASSELYNSVSGTWIPVASMHTPSVWGTMTLLPNGQVLAAGGACPYGAKTATAELYTPPGGS